MEGTKTVENLGPNNNQNVVFGSKPHRWKDHLS